MRGSATATRADARPTGRTWSMQPACADHKPLALVTGGTRRLGAAIAMALGAAGWRLAIHYGSDLDGATAIEASLAAQGSAAGTYQADLSSVVETSRLLRDVVAAAGDVDLLVLNASLFEGADLADMDVATLDRHHAVNVRASYQLLLELGKMWVARREREPAWQGRAVAVLCTSVESAWPTHIAYSASKAALASLVVGFAKRLAPAARVNGIAPGPLLPPAGGTPEQAERAVRRTLLGRMGTPADLAEAVLFFERATWLTGVVLNVDGGASLGGA